MAATTSASAQIASLIAKPTLRRFREELPHNIRCLEFPRTFTGREVGDKDRRLSSGIAPLDTLLGGGITHGRISEFIGGTSDGRTSLAASFAASATKRGEVVGWIDSASAFDPASMGAAGVILPRVLWVSVRENPVSRRFQKDPRTPFMSGPSLLLKAAELLLEAGGFGLVVIDFGEAPRALAYASALRIARAAERSGAAVIAIVPRRMCRTFAAQSLVVSRAATSYSRLAPGSPVIFDGLAMDVMVARNKMGGGTGRWIRVRAVVDPILNPFDEHPYLASKESPGQISLSS